MLPTGQIVATDYMHHVVQLVDPVTGALTPLAGAWDAAGNVDGVADAQLSKPQGLAATAGGDIYVTDLGNFRVRRISGGLVSTFAGTGVAGHADRDDRLAAQLYGLEGLAVAADGSMAFVADGSRGTTLPYNRIRSIKLQ